MDLEDRPRHAPAAPTGHARDYREGVAYRDYFATDELMFGVPELDRRPRNKAEVLALRLPGAPDEQLAIAVGHLWVNSVSRCPR